MEIKINESDLEQAINSRISVAIENALSGYGVQKAIEEKLTNDITMGIIGEALENAIRQLDTERLTNSLSSEIQKAMTSAVTNVVYNGLASVMMDLRKIPDYDSEKRDRARMEIMAQLRNEKA